MSPAITGLSICLRKLDGDPVTLYDNPFAQTLPEGSGDFCSYSTRSIAGEPFQVIVKFSTQYELHAASGVRITIAAGHGDLVSRLRHTQSFWIDKYNLYAERIFAIHSSWSIKDCQYIASRFKTPQRDLQSEQDSDTPTWQNHSIAAKGCIAVFVTRGDLVNGPVTPRQWRKTDPPPPHRYMATDIPKRISLDWFKPCENLDNGRVAIVELRNLADMAPGSIITREGQVDVISDSVRELPTIALDRGEAGDANGVGITQEPLNPSPSEGSSESLPCTPQPPFLAPSRSFLTPRAPVHTHGIPQSFTMSTKTFPVVNEGRISGLGYARNISGHGAGHTLNDSHNKTTVPKPSSPQEGAAAAAFKRSEQGNQNMTTSQQGPESGHRSKRAAPASKSSSRTGLDEAGPAKKSRDSEKRMLNSAGCNLHETPAREDAEIVDLTGDSDEEAVVKIKEEIVPQMSLPAYAPNVRQMSTQALDDEVLANRMEAMQRELRRRALHAQAGPRAETAAPQLLSDDAVKEE